jgi:hypothetical protein
MFTIQQVERALTGGGGVAEFDEDAFGNDGAVGEGPHILGKPGQPLERGEYDG